MAKMVVFYALLNHAEADILNAQGWDSEIGRAYSDVTIFPKSDTNFLPAAKLGIYKLAAIANFSDYEHAFAILNHQEGTWYENPMIQVFTNFPRSMGVGDIIFDTETREWMYCASFGFKQLDPLAHGETIAILTRRIAELAAAAQAIVEARV